jgi:hypothetical protein
MRELGGRPEQFRADRILQDIPHHALRCLGLAQDVIMKTLLPEPMTCTLLPRERRLLFERPHELETV